MASIEFTDIYSRFYLRVKDYETVGLNEQLVKEMLKGYLKSTLSKPMVRRLFASLSMDEDVEELDDSSSSDSEKGKQEKSAGDKAESDAPAESNSEQKEESE